MLQFILDFLHNVQAICMQLPTSSSCLTCSVSKCRTLALARHFSNWQNRMKPFEASRSWALCDLGCPTCAIVPWFPKVLGVLWHLFPMSKLGGWNWIRPQGLCQWAWESQGDRHIDVHWRDDKRWPNLWGCLQGTADASKSRNKWRMASFLEKSMRYLEKTIYYL